MKFNFLLVLKSFQALRDKKMQNYLKSQRKFKITEPSPVKILLSKRL